MNGVRMMRDFAVLLFLLLSVSVVRAQSSYEDARAYLDARDYQRALSLYKDLYAQHPTPEVIAEYLLVLTELKDLKAAEQIASDQLRREPANPLKMIFLGNVLKAQKKDKKAEELFAAALQYVNGDDLVTQQMASAFRNAGNIPWTIRTYERAIAVTQSPGLYSSSLAKLYNSQGETAKAVEMLLAGSVNMPQMGGDASLEASLLELIGSDPEKQRIAQRSIIKMLNTQPENYLYTNLLIWIFSVQNNWDQALIQVLALEKRNIEKGRVLLDFAAMAASKQQYSVAAKAYESIKAYGPSNPLSRYAEERRLSLLFSQLENEANPRREAIQSIVAEFQAFFAEHADAYAQPLAQEYARLEAQYHSDVVEGIRILQQSVQSPLAGKTFIGECKLQLGDYQVLSGNLWEAALLYAQVDKAFKQDALGEDARYRNARLSYYRHDFEQAQGQLSVLKASTSELIANDAMALSLLITENTPTDSNMYPLQRFAYADLLMFQNKDTEATALLDSINRSFPKHSLADDILMLRAKLAIKHHRYEEAVSLLQQIQEKHGKDVLADDAVFQIAELYRLYMNKPAEAKRYYEELITAYPGSSFLRPARQYLRALEPNP